MSKTITKTYDCCLDLCVNLKRSFFGVLEFKQMCYNVSGKTGLFICDWRHGEYLGHKIVTVIVCSVRCVQFFVQLINSGINERLFIECNWEQLCSNYSHNYSNFNFETDSDDSDDLSDHEQQVDGLFQEQLRQSFCFTELRLYNFKYGRLYFNCRKTFKMSLNQNYTLFLRFLLICSSYCNTTFC